MGKQRKTLAQQAEREKRELTKFAFFDPRFVVTYGLWGRLALIAVSIPILVLGIIWLDPTKRDYTENEVFSLWIGIAIMPIASFMAGNVIGEFVIKGLTLAASVAKQGFKSRIQTRFLCVLSILLAFGGVVSLLTLGDGDLWAYPALGLSVFVFYWFVKYSWSDWFEQKIAQQD